MDLSAAHGARGRSERGRAQAINTEFVAALGRDDHDHVFVVVVVRRLSRERGEAHRTLALLTRACAFVVLRSVHILGILLLVDHEAAIRDPRGRDEHRFRLHRRVRRRVLARARALRRTARRGDLIGHMTHAQRAQNRMCDEERVLLTFTILWNSRLVPAAAAPLPAPQLATPLPLRVTT